MSRIERIFRTAFRAAFPKVQLANLIRRGLIVGNNFNVQEGVSIHFGCYWLISIGNDVTLAPRVSNIVHDASTKGALGKTRVGKVKVGNRVFIGESSIILPGVTIGDDVVIGAGSVVTRDIPDGVIACGNPCRVIGKMEEFIERKKTEMYRLPKFRRRIHRKEECDMGNEERNG